MGVTVPGTVGDMGDEESCPPGGHRTGLVGRARDMEAVIRLLRDHRMVTVTGAGGVGKTRLARAVLPRVGADLAVRTWSVDLAGVAAGGPVVPAVAAAVGVAATPEGARVETLVDQVRHRPSLLVLDTCEHVVTRSADLIEHLLATCPQLRVLATSREPLRVVGERRWPITPLTVGDPVACRKLSDLAAAPAVRLFVERAVAVDPDFTLSERNAVAVATICARFDGLPLAIEQAAARMAALPIEELAGRPDAMRHLLDHERGGAVHRHRTIRACLDWSYRLLGDAERVVLRRLAALGGDFALADVESVAGSAPLTAQEILPVLSLLVDRSLVHVRPGPGPRRYTLFETVRWYAAEKLARSGEEVEVRRRVARLSEPLPAPGPVVVRPDAGPASLVERLHVVALGASREMRGDRLLRPADWTYQKPRELLYLLLSRPSCDKAEIGLALWPDAGPTTLRNSFHTSVRYLRQALGGRQWVTFRDGRYAVNRSLPYFHDVEEFEERLDAADAVGSDEEVVPLLTQAVSRYAGDYLVDLVGGAWIEERRLVLRGRVERALWTLARLLFTSGRPEQATQSLIRLLEFDGLREPAHRQLMRCYAAMGDRGRAVRQYRDLAARLADELGVRPAAETVALYDRLRTR